MPEHVGPAARYWEVERCFNEQAQKPYSVVILRSRKNKKNSIIKASSSDHQSMQEYAERLHSDLYSLTNDEFIYKYQLNSIT